MANEIVINASLTYADSESADLALGVIDLTKSITTKKFAWMKQAVGFAAEEAIVLGEVTAPGWGLFINRDATNFVKLLTGTGGVIFAKLFPGEFALLRLGSGAQVPYAQADTASVALEYLLLST